MPLNHTRHRVRLNTVDTKMKFKTVAYFCNEFGIDNDLPTYSGGLGILAGDTIHAAADMDYPMLGIGILYKGKSFMQHITGEGKEEKRDSEFDHDTSFLRSTTVNGKTLVIPILSENDDVKAKCYQIRLSDKTLSFFLSTDVDGNPKESISDMDALYHGDVKSLIRQHILLGLGGIGLLNALNIKPSYYHINEGRPAFIVWELAKDIHKQRNISFEEAWKETKEKIIYTNHTLVKAGNVVFPKEDIYNWAELFVRKNDIDIDPEFLIREGLEWDTFNTTLFSLNISKKHTSVSKLHLKYAKDSYPNNEWISITNGIHLPRWQDSDFRNEKLSDTDIWSLHLAKKRELLDTVIKRTGLGFDPDKLIITWARRLAEYKQPKIIFEDLNNLIDILNNEKYPIQLLFAGNSHSADPNSKSIIEEVIKIFSKELSGLAIFVPNYNISLANHLTSGSDLWLNTPQGNLEACGTSGMKAISNGVLNFTVIDGWTKEVNWEGVGWTIDPQNVSRNFYEVLKDEIAPLYYKRNENGIPDGWIERMRKSIKVANDFSAERMLENYIKLLYR